MKRVRVDGSRVGGSREAFARIGTSLFWPSDLNSYLQHYLAYQPNMTPIICVDLIDMVPHAVSYTHLTLPTKA